MNKLVLYVLCVILGSFVYGLLLKTRAHCFTLFLLSVDKGTSDKTNPLSVREPAVEPFYSYQWYRLISWLIPVYRG